MNMAKLTNYISIDNPDDFWAHLSTLPPSDRWAPLYVYALFLIDAHRVGLATRRQVGTALSPMWHTEPFNQTAEFVAAANYAIELKLGGFEDEDDARYSFKELASIIEKYR